MRTLALALTAVVVALLTVSVTTRPASACSCAVAPLEEYADGVGVAFTGTQISRADIGGDFDSQALLTFEIDQVYTGTVGETFTAWTAGDSAGCGVDYAARGPVALAAFGEGEDVSLGLCGSEVSEEELAAVFGDPTDPDPEAIDLLAADLPAVELPAIDEGRQPLVEGNGGGRSWVVVVMGVALGALALVGLYFVGTVRLRSDE